MSRPVLKSSTTADVVIIGGGFSGLWTAFHLLTAAAETDRPIDVVICEARYCGFGASGCNGGWCSALVATVALVATTKIGRAHV